MDYDAYRKFTDDYLSMGYIKPASQPVKYIIPYHAIVKRDGDVSKLLVVFDASLRPSSIRSLNYVLFVGAKLRFDIRDILLSARIRKHLFTAGIVKVLY